MIETVEFRNFKALQAATARLSDLTLIVGPNASGKTERLRGLNQARECGRWSFAIAIGVAHPKRECWILAAFQPDDDDDRSCLEVLRKELGFDPCAASHKLTASKDSAKRSAKRVLRVLCGEDTGKAEGDLKVAALELLKQRGHRNGLAEFTAEVETHLLPLFG